MFLVTVYQVPGLAPPGVVIPQLASAPRLDIPGPGVVIPQLSTTGSCLLLTDNFFFKLSLKNVIFLSFGKGLR